MDYNKRFIKQHNLKVYYKVGDQKFKTHSEAYAFCMHQIKTTGTTLGIEQACDDIPTLPKLPTPNYDYSKQGENHA